MKFGVFDSGIGGEAIATTLRTNFPNADVIVINDKANLPYGNKSLEEVTRLTDRAIQPLLQENCDVLIIACNTATAAAIETLRHRYPQQLFIGLEPMVKPAAELTKSNIVAVCATPTTLSSHRYQTLKERFASDITIIEPDCSDWAYMIEENQLNQEHIVSTINTICEQDADIIVLACTHYHWIKDLIIENANGRATVIDPSEAIVARIKQLQNIN